MPQDWSRFWFKYNIHRSEGEPLKASGPIFDIDKFESEFGTRARKIISQSFQDRADRIVNPKSAKRYLKEKEILKSEWNIDIEALFTAQNDTKGDLRQL
jgi:hypothetical protein